jgi:hypothetical protein
MRANKTSFICYFDWAECCTALTTEQIGKLTLAVFAFARGGEQYAGSDPYIKMAFSFIAHNIERDQKKYEETCKKRAEYGKRGGQATAALRRELNEYEE